MKFLLKIIIVFTFWLTSIISYCQDTIRYEEFQKTGRKTLVIISSIELYSDSLFTWKSEHDLSWSEYGIYNINENILTLNFYYSDFDRINRDSIDLNFIKKNREIKKTIKYLITETKMYEIKKNGRLKKWTNGRTMFIDRWRWLTLGYRRIYFVLK